MNQCLICNNKTKKYQSLCSGCKSLLSQTEFTCPQCGIELQNQQSICGKCQRHPPHFDSAAYVSSYQPPVDKWVMGLKFGKKIIFSKMFAELMLPFVNTTDSHYILMPVPLHAQRLRNRGYNQSYEIAKELSKLSGRELNTSLIRIKNTKMQAQLKFNQREKNVKRAFSVDETFNKTHIILIDDVMTSGNTLNECAKTLKKAGAYDIKVLVFARKSY